MQVSLATGRRPSLDVVSSPSPPLLSPKVKMFTALVVTVSIVMDPKLIFQGDKDAQGLSFVLVSSSLFIQSPINHETARMKKENTLPFQNNMLESTYRCLVRLGNESTYFVHPVFKGPVIRKIVPRLLNLPKISN